MCARPPGEGGTVDERVTALVALLERSNGAAYIGEPVSQLAHGLQAAAYARAAGATDPEVLAALLHDVGHSCAHPDAPRMAGLGVLRHEEVGADYLERIGFGFEVTRLVRGHVDAKRYLAARDPAYVGHLSAASRATLDHQGGPMSDPERHVFESDPHHLLVLRLRSWDERAKEPGRSVPGLDAYVPLLRDHLSRR